MMDGALDRRAKPLPSTEELHALLLYDPETGFLTWKPRPVSMFSGIHARRACAIWNARFAGKPALIHANDQGYLQGRINGVLYRAHRIAWKMFYGAEPDDLDHIDGDTRRNAISNLRSVCHSDNMRNIKLRADSTSGVTGVCRCGDRWRAYISDNGRTIHLGVFPSIKEAAAARARASQSAGYHANHGRDARHHSEWRRART